MTISTRSQRSDPESSGPEAELAVTDSVRWLAAQARGRVLDIGCGHGDTTLLCARRGLEALGVDIRPGSVARALALRQQEHTWVQALVSFEVADAADLHLSDADFDTVLLGEVIEEHREASPILAEAVRVLRPGGRLALTTPFGYSPDREHRATFYVASLIESVGRHATIESLEITRGYFRVVARPGRMDAEDRVRLGSDLQPTFEQALLRAQRARHNDAEALGRKLSEEAYRSRVSEWKLRSIQARRWWRLAEVLRHASSWPGPLLLPRDLARALRRVPRPRRPKPLARPAAAPAPAPARAAGVQAPKSPDVTGHYCSVDLPGPVELPSGPIARPSLTVATILDVFSARAFGYEWNQLQPGPDDWREVLERDRPALLFVESAWWGNSGRWRGALTATDGPPRQIRDLISWCRERSIPTVLWNKEDPPHFERFLDTAKLFDHVFTVDADCLPRYRAALGHDRVDQLSFAAQPRIHNPTAVPGGRRHNVAFAGTYYTYKYPERAAQMAAVVAPAREFGLHIFSRVTENLRCQFPPAYADHIVGSLPYERMLAAYKAYKIFLNVNSVTHSATMCARRVFELSACATPVVSAHSLALESVFGDLVRMSRSREETARALEELLADDSRRDRQAHLAMRAVFDKHTYAHRVDTVLRAVGLSSMRQTRAASVVVTLDDTEMISHVLEQMSDQSHREIQLVVVLRGMDIDTKVVEDKARAAGIADVLARAVPADLSRGVCLNLGVEAADGRHVAIIDAANYVGKHYLADLLAAFSYTRAGIVGKAAYYLHRPSSGETILRSPHLEHTDCDRIEGSTMVADADVLRRLRFADRRVGVFEDLFRRARADHVGIYSADRFNFVSVREGDALRHDHGTSDAERLAFRGDPRPHVCF
jgi:SAM-dependent methyltransferase/spore maturation protein CgeB